MNNEITFFAQTTFRGEKKKFGIKTADRRQHLYLIGKTGMGKSEMEVIADFFKKVLIEKKNIKQEVAEFRKNFQDVKYCFQSSNQGYEYLKFY